MAFSFYKAYSGMAKSPQQEWQESYQEGLDDFWDNTSTVATIQMQTGVGVKEYVPEEVQLTSIINPTTGETFGDRYRKLVHKTYITTDNWLGKMYHFDDGYWLTINTNTIIGSLKTSIVQYCNNELKWIASDGAIKSWKCVYTRNISSTNFISGSKEVAQINADAKILVQRNSETDLIPFNQRFLFDGHAFQVKQIDNHYSDTLMSIYIFEVPLQVNDDIANNLAGGNGEIQPNVTETKILPNVTKILQGKTQAYVVKSYVNGIENTDSFGITGTQAPEVNYVLTAINGNTFAVENKAPSPIPLVVECRNERTLEVTKISIVLGGKW